MKIEDVELGNRYKTNNGYTGKAMQTRRDTLLDGRYEVKLVSDTWSRWVHVADIEPVDESPKEVPTASYDGKNYIPPHVPLSIADTPVSQLTLRQYLIVEGFGGWWANEGTQATVSHLINTVDELIAEMEKTKK